MTGTAPAKGFDASTVTGTGGGVGTVGAATLGGAGVTWADATVGTTGGAAGGATTGTAGGAGGTGGGDGGSFFPQPTRRDATANQGSRSIFTPQLTALGNDYKPWEVPIRVPRIWTLRLLGPRASSLSSS